MLPASPEDRNRARPRVTNLTEQAAEEFIAARAFAPAPPSFVGAAVGVLLDRPAAPGRAPLRHGFREAVSSRVVVVSGPPSPGLEACLTRMAEDASRTVRRIVAARADAPPGALRALTTDPDRATREAVASNPGMPPSSRSSTTRTGRSAGRWCATPPPTFRPRLGRARGGPVPARPRPFGQRPRMVGHPPGYDA